jgi:hypothetical protein
LVHHASVGVDEQRLRGKFEFRFCVLSDPPPRRIRGSLWVRCMCPGFCDQKNRTFEINLTFETKAVVKTARLSILQHSCISLRDSYHRGAAEKIPN